MATESTPRVHPIAASHAAAEDAAILDASSETRGGEDDALNAQALRDTQILLQAELSDARLLQELSARLIEHHGASDIYEQFVDAAMVLMHSDCGSMQMLRTDAAGEQYLQLIVHRG